MNIESRIHALLEQIEQKGASRHIRPFAGDHADIDLADNDYLGLASDIPLRQAFMDEIGHRFRLSASASPLLMAQSDAHCWLDETIYRIYGRPSVGFASGWHANTGFISALAAAFGGRLLILSDRLAHASMLDGIRLATTYHVTFKRFRHNDVADLQRLLSRFADNYEAVLILTESVFSMDGDRAHLSEICALKQEFGNLLIAVDEAHSLGVLGPNGYGCVRANNLDQKVDFLIGTFGKAMAASGAFIVCSPLMHSLLVNTCRPLIYSTAEPEIIAAWKAWLLERLPAFKDRRERLKSTSRLVRDAIFRVTRPEFQLMASDTHIVPYMIGDNETANRVREHFLQAGIRAALVRPPTVPLNTARLRLSLKATLSDLDINRILTAVASSPLKGMA